MPRVTSRLQRWQNYMNCTSNCFCTHPILQIWPPVTTGCLQTSKECSRKRDLASMKKWYWIWFPWRSDIRDQRQIVLQKKHQIVREVLKSVYYSRKRLKLNFAKKLLFYKLDLGLIEWCVIQINKESEGERDRWIERERKRNK